MEIIPIHADVLVEDLFFGQIVTKSGLIILDDDGKDRGIHPRWAKVYAVGGENKLDIKKGDWVLIEHGRWTRGIEIELDSKRKIRKVDPSALLMKSETEPKAENWYFRGKD